jgi:peptide deformylase
MTNNMANILDIVLYPDPRLREKSRTLDDNHINDPKFQRLLDDMAVTMTAKDGAGLAAPQIGQHIRVICLSHHSQPTFLINPIITKRSWGMATEDEGCLSVLNKEREIVFGKVERNKRVTCSFIDRDGKKRKVQADGMLARAIQHEIDHLDGVLFIDRMDEKDVVALGL